jgi:hypothetical protein
MRNYPDNEDETREALDELACEQWMLDQLRRNPDYPHWGPHEDYQWVQDFHNPDSPREFSDWDHFKRCFTVGKHPENPDDRSGGEIVNWYFSLERQQHECRDCERSGLNPATKRLSDHWYNHMHPTGNGWSHQLTQDEVDALQESGRLNELCGMRTLEELEILVTAGKIERAEAVARWEARDASKDLVLDNGSIVNRMVHWRDHIPADDLNEAYRKGIGHDAINQWICVETRAKRLGVWGTCLTCEGTGRISVEPRGRLAIVLWVVNPRTGQNYGVEILSVRETDLSEVYEFVLSCGQRLAEHLDLPDLRTFTDVAEVARRESAWTRPGSGLDGDPRYPQSWCAPVEQASWKEMRLVRDWRGNPVPPEDPQHAKLGPSWELDCYNELIGIDFEPNGRYPGRLHFWMAHPRKGASRRLTIASYDEGDLPDIVAWVRGARERTLKRFACRPEE